MNDYPDQWQLLSECPEFLYANKKFGSIHIFDNAPLAICSGWTLIHTHEDSIQFENLGLDFKCRNELDALKTFIERFFYTDLQEEIHASLEIIQNVLVVRVRPHLVRRILLQVTKPSADVCKFILSERMHFPGYWNVEDWEHEKQAFELSFEYSSRGCLINLPNDYHMMHQYGAVVSTYPETAAWLKRILNKLPISQCLEIDPCTFQISKLSDFLYLTDRFRERRN